MSIGPRFAIRIEQLVLRTTAESCPFFVRATDVSERYTPDLPKNFPGITKEEAEMRHAMFAAEKLWPRIWPDHGCEKTICLTLGAMAILGGNAASTHQYPTTRPSGFPNTTDYMSHTYVHEFSHTFHGDHQTGAEEAPGVYFGRKPGSKRPTGSQVQHYRDYYVAAKMGTFHVNTSMYPHYKEPPTVNTKKLLIKEDTSDVQLPPYACIDMLELANNQDRYVIDVLANDWDYNGDKLTIVSTEPSLWGGRTEIKENKIVYTPPARIVGIERLKYTIADSTGWQATGIVVINMVQESEKVFDLEAEKDIAKDVSFATDTHTNDDRYYGVPLAFTKDAKRGTVEGQGVREFSRTIEVSKAGNYNLRIRFFILENRKNGTQPREVCLTINGTNSRVRTYDAEKPVGWKTMTYYNVPLKKGKNVLQFASMVNVKPEKREARFTWSDTTGPSVEPTFINSVHLSPATAYTVRFAKAEPSGVYTLLDTGEAFNEKFKGVAYGWSNAVAVREWEDYARFNDQWEIAVPNGKYNVFLTGTGSSSGAVDRVRYKRGACAPNGSGKVSFFNDFLVEGVRLFEKDGPENIRNFLWGRVTVNDGRLTVELGPKANESGIQSISIVRAE